MISNAITSNLKYKLLSDYSQYQKQDLICCNPRNGEIVRGSGRLREDRTDFGEPRCKNNMEVWYSQVNMIEIIPVRLITYRRVERFYLECAPSRE